MSCHVDTQFHTRGANFFFDGVLDVEMEDAIWTMALDAIRGGASPTRTLLQVRLELFRHFFETCEWHVAGQQKPQHTYLADHALAVLSDHQKDAALGYLDALCTKQGYAPRDVVSSAVRAVGREKARPPATPRRRMDALEF